MSDNILNQRNSSMPIWATFCSGNESSGRGVWSDEASRVFQTPAVRGCAFEWCGVSSSVNSMYYKLVRILMFSQRYNGESRSCAMRRRVFGRVVPDVAEYSIAFKFTTERSANVGNTRFRNVGFRSIVLPSHSRPRDPLMWAIRGFETSGFGV
jgi:hypothetical protein